jgi:formylglycine-generating enzyme required for sulfatase activity
MTPRRSLLTLCLVSSTALASPQDAASVASATKNAQLQQQREEVLKEVEKVHKLTPEQTRQMREVFNGSAFIGQGNPAVTKRPLTREECRTRASSAKVSFENAENERICKGPYMAPLYNPATQKPSDAKSCVDLFEFPNVPCDYPVVWVRTREAHLICESMGKRLCDAHEWEGACEGSLQQPDYPWHLAKGKDANAAVNAMRFEYNRTHKHLYAYGGSEYRKGVCAANSTKDSACNGGQWKTCGSNHYPAGSFPSCKSPLGVYDLHGNAAEHMNLPLNESQMTSKGSKELGVTEMKGSWFIWDKYQAHPDWCRWRAPYWHGTRVMDKESHHNYHLGFRCCKSL